MRRRIEAMDRSLQGQCITVTGAGGFLGPPAVDALARKGARVQAIIGPPNETARIPPGAAYVAQVDVCDSPALRKLIAGLGSPWAKTGNIRLSPGRRRPRIQARNE